MIGVWTLARLFGRALKRALGAYFLFEESAGTLFREL
jgi:hypothetical protein